MHVVSASFLQDVETFYDLLVSRRESQQVLQQILQQPRLSRALSSSSIASSVKSSSSNSSTIPARQFLHDATMFMQRARQAKEKTNVDSIFYFFLRYRQTHPGYD
ncbi:hypothetical protein K7432_007096 [Basidiobolus ranarum]|uniref:Uncharacterized protein n=1 Tax=Basidiobolus ranarum TaxID=34480 RepID=A0ABR2WU60_9FUNG